MTHLIKDLRLAIENRQGVDDEKYSGGFWDLSLEIMESESPQELIYNYLVAFSELLENKLMNKSDIELMLKIIDNYKDDAFYMAVEDKNSLIGLEEIETLESKLKGLKNE